MKNSIVYWRGKSRLDGKPIALYLTFNSANSGTGSMVQSWIMVDGTDPINAARQGLDASVCGDCPLRGVGNKMRSCYVNLMMGPNVLNRTLSKEPVCTDKKGIATKLKGRRLRIGAYGDPVAVPFAVWQRLIKMTSGHTGYTHQWMSAKAKQFRSIIMASCETETQATLAQSKGWRTFRVRQSTDSVMSNEIICPKSNEGGNREQCLTCMACSGYNRPGQRNVVIVQHGSVPTLKSFQRFRESSLT